ncbi:TPA: bacteriocin class II family protein [Streptococcus pneumoniae]|nr:bacteriocin class II family protein [Streptococcus pneumoniae]MBW7543327.1 bacteriocin class II family protein [Streptococcus pneumoniae]HEU7113378.1 bacteriocin class II family protein [Streptococcus pneumoniae]HEU7460537.1 bacteriocin class II family protein [Streptococcus pneumoniae]HEW3180758.1 bacteriocin class II family protein [Streptococcus pneumoniae]
MNTKMMEQFSVMDTEMLACVEGGGCNWEILPKQVLEEQQQEVFN